MKFSFVLLLFSLVFFSSFSQEIPRVNIGVGYPLFYSSVANSSGTSVFIGKNNINLFAEIPGLLVLQKKS